jgi:hypothetical protein
MQRRYTMNFQMWLPAMMCAAAAMPAWAQVSAKPGETVVLSVHAVGAQVYDCKAGEGGKLAWQFREPIATLIQDGETVGRHYKGPTWEHIDGSRIRGKQVDTQPGETVGDIPWLRLDVIEAGGSGVLAGVTAILRINTKGGKFAGACDRGGTIMGAPYAADYMFEVVGLHRHCG